MSTAVTTEQLNLSSEDAQKTSTASEAAAVAENNHMLLTVINGTPNICPPFMQSLCVKTVSASSKVIGCFSDTSHAILHTDYADIPPPPGWFSDLSKSPQSQLYSRQSSLRGHETGRETPAGSADPD